MCFTKCADKCFFAYVMIEQVRRRRENIKKKTDGLLKHVEPQFELLDNLRTKDVFSTDAIDDIIAEKTKSRRVDKTLFHLRYVDEDGYRSFLEALRDSSQTHIINYINGDYNTCLVLWPGKVMTKASDLVIGRSLVRVLARPAAWQRLTTWASRSHTPVHWGMTIEQLAPVISSRNSSEPTVHSLCSGQLSLSSFRG